MSRPDLNPGERVQRICDAYRRGVPVREIADTIGVQKPAIYKALRRGGVLPPYKPFDGTGRKRGRPKGSVSFSYATPSRYRPDDNNLPPRVHREPCPRCGVRRDFGCNHGGGRIGVEMAL